jgi:glycosyltransferase involved in cell wall biosynthesis
MATDPGGASSFSIVTAPYDISIVIPTLADDATLVNLLSTIRHWPRQPREIIVADGASNSAVRSACARYAARWLPSVPGRSVQLMKGASRASGSVLWFLHPDGSPDPDAIQAIIESVDSGASGGCFTFRFNGRPRPIKTLLERCIAWRVRFGLPDFEHGVYVTREAFDVCGGFAATPLFEEVPLLKGLQRQGRFDVLTLAILVSDRRWQRDGWLMRTLSNRLLAFGFALGIPPARLARWFARSRAENSAIPDRRANV